MLLSETTSERLKMRNLHGEVSYKLKDYHCGIYENHKHVLVST